MEQEAIIAGGILVIVEGLKDLGMPSKYARIVSVLLGGFVGVFVFTDNFPLNVLRGVITGATTTIAYGGIKSIGQPKTETKVEVVESNTEVIPDKELMG